MRLERVIAKDSRRATEQVIEQFGADALIISNQKVNGMTEIVVAVDIDAEPLEARPINREVSSSRQVTEGGSDAASPLIQSAKTRSEPVLASMPRTPVDREPALDTWTAERFGKVLQQSFAGNREADASAPRDGRPGSPTGSKPRTTATPPAAPIPGWLTAQPSSAQPVRETPAEDTPADSLRARELVDMVREELASMRREIALSRQIGSNAVSRRLAPEVQPIADALEEAGAPIALRTLLLDQIAQSTDIRDALTSIRTMLCESIQVQAQRGRLEGINVIAGPSGGGKTLMACKLAARHAASRGAGSVALISFADARIGAWTQLQMLAARTGIECFRVSDTALLGALLSELASRELILIETSASGWKESLSAIAECAPSARFHLVLPADTSGATVHRHQSGDAWQWTSLMLSKIDESSQPWFVIQALCNQNFTLSVGSNNPAPESSPLEIDPADLVSGALSHCAELADALRPPPARPRRSPTRKAPKEIRHAA